MATGDRPLARVLSPVGFSETVRGGALSPRVYWHRDLPPADAELMGDHTLEATSSRVSGTLAHRDELWDRCCRELMDCARARLAQEIGRLGGDYAHVTAEHIEPRHDDRTGEAWMHGQFDYQLYRRPPIGA